MERKYIALTHAENRIYTMQKMYPESCMWNVPLSIRFAQADRSLIKKALHHVYDTTVGMKARFTEIAAGPVKYTSADTLFHENITFKNDQDYLKWAEDQSKTMQPMLNKQPFQIVLAETGNQTIYLYSNFHHIIADGGAANLFQQRVIRTYQQLTKGEKVPSFESPPIDLAYQKEQEYLSSQQFTEDKNYWNHLLETMPDPMDISGKPESQSLVLKKHNICFPKALTTDLRSFCTKHKVSPFRVILAALSLIMSRTLRRNDLIFGTATANRHPKALYESMGMFVGTGVFRIQFEESPSFMDLVSLASQSVRNTIKHEQYPFNILMQDIQKRLGEKPDLLSCTIVEMVNHPMPEGIEFIPHCQGESIIPLSLFVRFPHRTAPANDPILISTMYNKELFEEWKIKDLCERIPLVLKRVLKNPAQKINEIDILSSREKKELIETFNQTESNWPLETTINQCFDKIVQRFPKHIAVVYRGQKINYYTLNKKADSLAWNLQKQGVHQGDIIGLLADRSLEIIIAQLAVLKCGAAFMPIDAGYPDTRIQYMLQDAQSKILLTQKRFIEALDLHTTPVLDLEDQTHYDSNHRPEGNVPTPYDLCSVIYTSGSTGNPKGVLLEHRAIANSIHATIKLCHVSESDCISKHASFSFDASMFEIFTALMSGAQLHLIPEEIRLSLGQLNEYFENNHISFAFLTTQLCEQFMEHIDNHSLRVLCTGGEKLRTFKKRKYQLFNMYGPTECSFYSSYFIVEKEPQINENIPIGQVSINHHIYILDKEGHHQPAGYGGELCIGGMGLARGYQNLPEKTETTFVPNPFRPTERMYRTGDLACRIPDGNLLHLGRIDRQVKLRGYRIELGEIENALLTLEGIKEAAIADFKDRYGHVFLCGFYCGTEQKEEALHAQLKGTIPDFMIPAYFVYLDHMPVNSSGKIDRKKLQKPDQKNSENNEYIEPDTELEKALTCIWEKTLDRKKLGAGADFFTLGGDSLQAVKLQFEISQTLHTDIALSVIIKHCTPQKLASYLEENQDTSITITPSEKADYYPTTVSQQQLYLLQGMKGLDTAYNMPLCIRLENKVQLKKLSDTLLHLLKRHESLRTSFSIKEGKCIQKIEEEPSLKLEFSHGKSENPMDYRKGFIRPFDLEKPPLMRAKLIQIQENLHLLLLDFHHIAFDGVSVGIFLNELVKLYQNNELAPLTLQHKDFAVWENQNLETFCKEHENYWLSTFQNPPQSELSTDYARTGSPDFEGTKYLHVVPSELTKKIHTFAKKHSVTLHQLFISALSVATSRWSDHEDICLGTSMSGRDRPEVAGLIGMFVKTLPLRFQLDKNPSFIELLEDTKEQMQAVREHIDYPMNLLFEKLGIQRGAGRHPLFDINFVMRNTGAKMHFDTETLQAEVIGMSEGKAKFDLSIAAEDMGKEIILEIDFRSALFKKSTITRMIGHFVKLIKDAVASPDKKIKELEILQTEELDALLHHFNPTETPLPDWPTVGYAIETIAQKYPNKIAVVAEDGKLTYQQLNERANQIAWSILNCGPCLDKIAAVISDRTTNSVIGMLGAIKAGAGYVGIDTHYPPERIDFILKDTDAVALIGSQQYLESIEFHTKINVQTPPSTKNKNPNTAKGGNHLAYCIFTSGSTGLPKGVLIEHHSMINFINWYATHHVMNLESNCAAFAAFSFDVSVVQVFAPLVSGSTLHIITEDMRRSPLDLDQYFNENHITHAHFPTQFAEQFIKLCSMRSLEHLIIGGDRLRQYKLENTILTNEYGPSETTMACLSYDIEKEEPQPPIGSPVANTRVYILDSNDRLCPIGIGGEICVSGEGVGRGYLNRSDLTEKSFVSDPFVKGARMYRTGDKGRWLENGMIDFIGRLDYQVKIRGYRIEPGEIETAMKALEDIDECVVIAHKEPGGNKSLAAYFTSENEPEATTLKESLKRDLPEYMIPAYFVHLPKMPLSPNGKIDRKKLPKPEASAKENESIKPQTEKQKEIAHAWTEVLGHNQFSIHDSFYEIGGDSLSAIALMAELSQSYEVTASDLFMYTTIAQQAAHFQEAEISRSTRLMKLKELIKTDPTENTLEEKYKEYEKNCTKDDQLDCEQQMAPEHIVLTGATGTLGIYLLREILTKTNTNITVIVRADNKKSAIKRLEDHYLERFEKPLTNEEKQRLDILSGDLSKPQLGLSQTLFQNLADTADTILHSAALTSHYGEWNLFESANIESLRQLISLAKTGRKKQIHHVSTTSVGAGKIENTSQAVFTEFDLDIGQKTSNYYVRSKLEAEKILAEEITNGLSATIYRAGNITCDSLTGKFQKNVEDNGFFQQLRAYVNLGAAPDMMDCRNMTYVDQAAEAIILLMQRQGLNGQTFHIHNPSLLSLSKALLDPELDLNFQQLSFEKFIEFFANHAHCEGFSAYAERLLLHCGWQEWLSNPDQTATHIETKRTVHTLKKCGFAWKNPSAKDLTLFVKKSLQDRISLLKNVSAFAGLDSEILLKLARKVIPEHYESEELIQKEGRAIENIRFIIDGMVETYRRNITGWIGTIHLDTDGACLGEECLIEKRNATNSVEAIDDTFSFACQVEDLRNIIKTEPELALAMIDILSARAERAERLYVSN